MAVLALHKIPKDLGLGHLPRVCDCRKHWPQVLVEGFRQFFGFFLPAVDITSGGFGQYGSSDIGAIDMEGLCVCGAQWEVGWMKAFF
jgi:hypothetical protein